MAPQERRAEQPNLHPITQRFRSLDRHLEKPFQVQRNQNAAVRMRFALLASALALCSFAVIDYQIFPDIAPQLVMIRIVASIVGFLTHYLLTFSKSYGKLHRYLSAYSIAVAGLGVVALAVVTPPSGSYDTYAGIIITMVFAYTFYRSDASLLTPAIWLAVLAYEFVILIVNPFPADLRNANSLFLIAAALTLTVTASISERMARQRYFLETQLGLERDQSSQLNQELELRVDERTQALEQQRAQAERLLERQTLVSQLSVALGQDRELAALHRTIREHLNRLLDIDALIISAYEPDARLIRAEFVFSNGRALDTSDFPPIPLANEGQGTQSEVIRTGQSLIISDWPAAMKRTNKEYIIGENGTVSDEVPEKRPNDSTHSALMVPMRSEDHVIGVLQVQSHDYDAYSADDEALLVALAQVIGVAIQNARLREQTAQGAEHRAQLEEQLRQASKMEAVGQLAGGVAHDFNNLLTVINGYSEMLISGALEDTEESLNEILQAGQRAASLTRQLLAFSRRQVLQIESVDLHRVLAESDKMLRRLIGEDIALTIEQTGRECTILADAGQIEQIIMNLVVNARDAIRESGRDGRISVGLQAISIDQELVQRHPDLAEGPGVRLWVGDNGTGIAPEHLEHLFEPFFTTKAMGHGTGLGLSTVYGIVTQMSGALEVHTEMSVGTRFDIYFPCAAQACPTGEEDTEHEAPHGTERLLVIEDEVALRRLVSRQLVEHGYAVTEAADGLQGLELLDHEPRAIDMIVSDIVMPNMGGIELADALRNHGFAGPILLMTGYTDDLVDADRLAQLRGAQLLRKPFSRTELLTSIRRILDQSAEDVSPG